MYRLKAYIAVAVAAMTLESFSACAAKVKSNGSCPRSCSNNIGGGKLRGSPISSGITITCTAGSKLAPFTYEFLIYEDTTYSKPSSGDVPPRIPQGSIAFTPQIPYGATLLTPANEWCTDACGIATISFNSDCIKQTGFVSVYAKGMLLDADNGAKAAFDIAYPD